MLRVVLFLLFFTNCSSAKVLCHPTSFFCRELKEKISSAITCCKVMVVPDFIPDFIKAIDYQAIRFPYFTVHFYHFSIFSKANFQS